MQRQAGTKHLWTVNSLACLYKAPGCVCLWICFGSLRGYTPKICPGICSEPVPGSNLDQSLDLLLLDCSGLQDTEQQSPSHKNVSSNLQEQQQNAPTHPRANAVSPCNSTWYLQQTQVCTAMDRLSAAMVTEGDPGFEADD